MPVKPLSPQAASRGELSTRRSGGQFRGVLRSATRSQHERVDAEFSVLDLSDPRSYGLFLQCHLLALSRLSHCWRSEDDEEFSQLIRCLQQDLADLGLESRLSRTGLSLSGSLPARWGLSYVIRGSRLGATLLRHRLQANLPAAFLEYEPLLRWSEFLDQLEALALEPPVRAQIIDGAMLAFAEFRVSSSLCKLPTAAVGIHAIQP